MKIEFKIWKISLILLMFSINAICYFNMPNRMIINSSGYSINKFWALLINPLFMIMLYGIEALKLIKPGSNKWGIFSAYIFIFWVNVVLLIVNI